MKWVKPLPADGADRTADVPGIFAEALEQTAEQRASFLDTACGGDAGLRAEVESLLAAHPAAAKFFEHGRGLMVLDDEEAAGSDALIGTTIGPWRVVREIATGGMGAVYLGERTDDAFRKQVAIKWIRPGLMGPDAVQRFRHERQVLANLEHPGIARLIDGGSTADGHPYLVMELIDGTPLHRHCQERRLDVPARLGLFLDVCEAVQYAHRNLVVHRDLKPANMLVDAGGRVRLLDFGIASVLDHPHGAVPHIGPQAYTARYASPEQIAGDRITTTSDVYSLGVVLAELLSESPRNRAGDVDAIVGKARAREPEDRYRTVEELAADVRSHLRGDPVAAHAPTVSYRLGKFVRRNWAPVAATTTALLTLVVALILTLRAYRQAEASRSEAELQAYVSSLAAAEASLVSDNVAEAAAHLDAAPTSLRGWEWWHLHGRLDRSLEQFRAHRIGITTASWQDGMLLTASIDSTLRLSRGGDTTSTQRFGPLPSEVESAEFIPGGVRLAAGLSDSGVVLVDRRSGSIERLEPQGGQFAQVSVSPDGSRLACGFFDGTVRIWLLGERRLLAEWQAQPRLAVPSYSPDGRWLAVGGSDGTITIHDARTNQARRRLAGHSRRIYELAWSPDGSRLASGSMDRTAMVWEVSTGRNVASFREHRGTVGSLAFDAAGERIVSAGADRRLLIWDAATGIRLATLSGHRADVSGITSTGDGRIYTADWDGMVRAWNWTTEEVRTLRPPPLDFMVPSFQHAALGPGDSTLACATSINKVYVWRLHDVTPFHQYSDVSGRRVVFMPGGATLLAASDSGNVIEFTVATESRRNTPIEHAGPVLALSISRAGDRIATSSSDGSIRLWSFPGYDTVRTLAGHRGAVFDLEFTPDGARIVSCGQDGTVRSWNSSTGESLLTIQASQKQINDLALDRLGVRIAAVSNDGSVQILGPGADPVFLRKPSQGAMISVAWSPDGARIAAGGSDQIVHLYDAVRGRELLNLHGHIGRVTSVRFTSNGRSLISTSSDGTARVWEREDERTP